MTMFCCMLITMAIHPIIAHGLSQAAKCSMALPKLNINGITMKKNCKLAMPPN